MKNTRRISPPKTSNMQKTTKESLKRSTNKTKVKQKIISPKKLYVG